MVMVCMVMVDVMMVVTFIVYMVMVYVVMVVMVMLIIGNGSYDDDGDFDGDCNEMVLVSGDTRCDYVGSDIRNYFYH